MVSIYQYTQLVLMCNCDLPKYKDEFIQEHALEFFSSSDLEIIVRGGWGKGQ